MQISKLIAILALCTLQFIGSAMAAERLHVGILYPAYSANAEFAKYAANRNLANLNNIPAELRAFAIADLIIHQDDNYEAENSFQVADRGLIMQKYFDDANPQFKSEVQALTFQLAIRGLDKTMALRLYDEAIKINPQLAQQYVCDSMATLARDPNEKNYKFDEDSLKKFGVAARNLNPMIAKMPFLERQSCQINSGGTVLSLTIGQLAKMAAKDMSPESKLSSVLTREVQQALFQEYSSCTDKQIENLMWQVTEKQLRETDASRVFVNFNYDQCAVRGEMHKIRGKGQNISFEFFPESASGGRRFDSIKFNYYPEITKTLKTNPQRYLITRPAAPPPVSGASASSAAKLAPESQDSKDLWESIKKDPWGLIRDQVKYMGTGAK